jgi:two-component system, OmpR family, response regulator ChvI
MIEGEEDEIAFSDKSQNCCVCFVSMVDSISATSGIKNPEKTRRYYSVFINTMAAIARNFGAKIIKNTASSLIFYFPKTSTTSLDSSYSSPSDSSTTTTFESALRDVLECGITMIAASDIINAKLKEEGGLPSLYYKISADYGTVEVARSLSSPDTKDLFGSTMNVCAKINSMAPVNGMVIGSDLYYIARKLSTSSAKSHDHYYNFKRVGEYSIAASFKHRYPVYSVISKRDNNNNILNLGEQIPKLKPLVQTQNEYIITTQQQQPKKDWKLPGINYNRYQQQQQQQQQQLPQQQQKDGCNILLVDDEPDILLTYKTFLLAAHEGYNVDAFTDSQKALQQFAQVNSPSYYDLVVMDVRMPGLNGLQLYYRLKAISPDIKVLFVSALDAVQEMISILPGVKLDDVVKKPVDEEQFLYKVRKMTLAA